MWWFTRYLFLYILKPLQQLLAIVPAILRCWQGLNFSTIRGCTYIFSLYSRVFAFITLQWKETQIQNLQNHSFLNEYASSIFTCIFNSNRILSSYLMNTRRTRAQIIFLSYFRFLHKVVLEYPNENCVSFAPCTIGEFF